MVHKLYLLYLSKQSKLYLWVYFELRKNIHTKKTTTISILWKHNLFYWPRVNNNTNIEESQLVQSSLIILLSISSFTYPFLQHYSNLMISAKSLRMELERYKGLNLLKMMHRNISSASYFSKHNLNQICWCFQLIYIVLSSSNKRFLNREYV